MVASAAPGLDQRPRVSCPQRRSRNSILNFCHLCCRMWQPSRRPHELLRQNSPVCRLAAPHHAGARKSAQSPKLPANTTSAVASVAPERHARRRATRSRTPHHRARALLLLRPTLGKVSASPGAVALPAPPGWWRHRASQSARTPGGSRCRGLTRQHRPGEPANLRGLTSSSCPVSRWTVLPLSRVTFSAAYPKAVCRPVSGSAAPPAGAPTSAGRTCAARRRGRRSRGCAPRAGPHRSQDPSHRRRWPSGHPSARTARPASPSP
jgi:hypothetical protein